MTISDKKQNINVDVPKEMHNFLTELKESRGSKSLSEEVRRALRLLIAVEENNKAGNPFGFLDYNDPGTSGKPKFKRVMLL